MKLAIIASHPVQYYAPWFRILATGGLLEIKVFYLWDFGVREQEDRKFRSSFVWDVPLLDGYDREMVPNRSSDPGTHHFNGLDNPSLISRILEWMPDVTLQFGYWNRSMMQFLYNRSCSRIPKMIRGDSHDLARRNGWKTALNQSVQRMIFARLDAFLYCGLANRAYFQRRGARAEQLFFCPHAVDTERFNANQVTLEDGRRKREELGFHARDRVILFAGKFESKKRPLDLIEAVRRIDDPHLRLILIGGGGMQDEVDQAAGTDRRIQMLPFQNQSQMPSWYAAADVFILPSRGPDETWGLAVQEALACGTPVIVSDQVGCHADLVVRRECGRVFPAGEVEALAEAIRSELAEGKGPERQAVMQSVLDQYSYRQATEGLGQAVAYLVEGY